MVEVRYTALGLSIAIKIIPAVVNIMPRNVNINPFNGFGLSVDSIELSF